VPLSLNPKPLSVRRLIVPSAISVLHLRGAARGKKKVALRSAWRQQPCVPRIAAGVED
jgi:hypothetical protein